MAFVSFIVTLTIGAGVIGWGALSLSASLAIFGVGMYFQNQFVTLETKLRSTIKQELDQEKLETRKFIEDEIKLIEKN